MAEDCNFEFAWVSKTHTYDDAAALRDIGHKLMKDAGYGDVFGGTDMKVKTADMGGTDMDFGMSDLTEGADYFLM